MIMMNSEYKNVKKYYQIMKKYREGEFGIANLSVHEILEKSGNNNLFDLMSREEIDYLIENSKGFQRQFFVEIKNKSLKKVLTK